MSLYYKKNQRRGEDNNVDDWLMTYADMITLILCFFAIFLSISVPKKDEFNQMRSEVMEQFAADSPEGKYSAAVTSKGAYSNKDYSSEEPEEETGQPPEPTFLSGRTSIAGNLEEGKDGGDEPSDRISSIDMNSASFFAVGAATLSDDGKKILDTVIETVQSDKFRDYQVTIEGHTDDSPISTAQFPSNWELSTGRAASVARYFLEKGISAQRLRASGYADTFPKVPNRDAAGNPIPENQAQNRRVVIRLEKIEKAQ